MCIKISNINEFAQHVKADNINELIYIHINIYTKCKNRDGMNVCNMKTDVCNM